MKSGPSLALMHKEGDGGGGGVGLYSDPICRHSGLAILFFADVLEMLPAKHP